MIFLLQQVLTGLASASALFLVASGLTIIFGVTRIVNFAHGSLFMLGAYLSVSLIAFFCRGYVGFCCVFILASLLVWVVCSFFFFAVFCLIIFEPILFM